MFQTPDARPKKLLAIEVDQGTSITRSIWGAVKDIENYLHIARPIGSLIYFYASQTYANGSPIEKPGDEWKFCDGSLVNDPESPLDGQNVPDLRNRFLRGGVNGGTVGGGVPFSFNHNHGGFTSFDSDIFPGNQNRTDPGFIYFGVSTHRHGFPFQNISYTPSTIYQDLQIYIRIK